MVMERDKNEDDLIEQVKQSVLACWLGGWHFLRGKSKTCSVLIMYRTCYSFFTSSIYRYFLAISDCIIVYH